MEDNYQQLPGCRYDGFLGSLLALDSVVERLEKRVLSNRGMGDLYHGPAEEFVPLLGARAVVNGLAALRESRNCRPRTPKRSVTAGA